MKSIILTLTTLLLFPLSGFSLNEKWQNLGFSCKESNGNFTSTTAPEQGQIQDDVLTFYSNGTVTRTMLDLGGGTEWETVYHKEGSPVLDENTGRPIIDQESGQPLLYGPNESVVIRNNDGTYRIQGREVDRASYRCKLSVEGSYTERGSSLQIRISSSRAEGNCPDELRELTRELRGRTETVNFERNGERVHILLPRDLYGNKCRGDIYETYSVRQR